MKIMTLHQPNFLPWYPFFQKVIQADVFVVLTQCQYQKHGYQNRFSFDGIWHTMSVLGGSHGSLHENIIDKRYANPLSDWNKIKSNLPQYRYLSLFDGAVSDSLVDTNLMFIELICLMLGIDTEKIVLDFPTSAKGTDRIIELCEHYGCDTYLSGISGSAYLDESVFVEKGIDLLFQDETTMDKRHVLEVLYA